MAVTGSIEDTCVFACCLSILPLCIMCSMSAGTNRALLCKSTVDGLQVTQLNMDHTTENEDELFRLSQLGEYSLHSANQKD